MKVLQIVGYKKSGKTTIVEALVKKLIADGLKVGVIKHHAHTESLKLPTSTDGECFFKNGALGSAIFSQHMNLLYLHEDFTIEDILTLYSSKGFDITIMEGFKQLSYPKVVLGRLGQELPPVSHAKLTLIGDDRQIEPIIELIDNL